MVLKNRTETYVDMVTMESLTRFCDVTFLVGKDRIPVDGIRAVIGNRSGPLQQLIDASEKKHMSKKKSVSSKVIKSSCSKLKILTCGVLGLNNFPQRLTIRMKMIDAETFERIITYIHCGILSVDASTVIGLMRAAYMFGIPELVQPCRDFAMGCALRTDNLRDIEESAKRYNGDETITAIMKEIGQRKAENPSPNDDSCIKVVCDNDSGLQGSYNQRSRVRTVKC